MQQIQQGMSEHGRARRRGRIGVELGERRGGAGRRVRVLVGLLLLGLLVGGVTLGPNWGSTGSAAPAVLVSEPFTGSSLGSPSSWVNSALTGWPTRVATSDYACLTAGTSGSSQTLSSGVMKGCAVSAIDSAGSGALRLTPAANSYSTFFLFNQPLTTRDGLDITFQQAQYGGNGADGLAFFLKNGNNASTDPGGSGEALGYSRWCSPPSSGVGSTGVPGGLIGVGFDTYGAYDCNSGTGTNYLAIKGADTSAAKDGTAGYAVLAGTSLASTPGSLTSGASTRAGRGRSVRIIVDPGTATTPTIKVWVGASGATFNPSTDTPTVQANMPSEYASATTFKFGFSAGTGGQNNIHEVWGLSIATATDPTYRVTYDGNGSTGGAAPSDATAYAATGTATVLGNTGSLVKTGSTFAGWNTAANGSGTSYAASATLTFASADVTLYAQWVAVPPAPAPAPAPAPVETPTPSSTPTPTPTPTAGNLDPIPNAVNGNVPVAGVPLGGSLYLLNGAPTSVRVVPNAVVAPSGLDVSGDGFFMRIAGRGGAGDPLGLGGQAQLVLESLQSAGRSSGTGVSGKCVPGKPVAVSSGNGFLAGSQVKVYLLPGTLIGSFPVAGDGSYGGSVPVPVGLPLGAQTLQANGFAPSGQVRSVSLGVQVVPVRPAVNRSSSAKVFFAPLSPELTVQGKRALDALVKRAGKSGRRAVVVGFVQQTSSTSNDQSLSMRRAQNVAAYLKGRGLPGSYQVRGDGTAGRGNDARRVNVTITYQPGC